LPHTPYFFSPFWRGMEKSSQRDTWVTKE
jgi:hypothetical protein